ncbi:hypothetical protein ABZ128_32870 [Streptomyces sp. NPDC006326]|uniref:hypothetical protein n=1 Tax=Streptomyces sp. NPDC006326 TaxID=3156752 RepID=UPI0033A277C9
MRPRRDTAPGAEAVGAWQLLTVWALVVVTEQTPVRSLAVIGAVSVGAVAVGFLHGMLLVKPLALAGRWTARMTAWPEPVAVAAVLAPVSAAVAAGVTWGLRSPVPVEQAGFLDVWAWTAASAVLPLATGAVLRGRRVAAREVWRRGAVVAGSITGVVMLMSFVMELPL